jgi:hypothetical protein
MPDSTLTKRSVALWRVIRVETACAVCLIDCGISMHLVTKILLRDLRSVLARKSFVVLLFWNVFRPKREGFVDPQFKLLSVGSIWLDPNIMTYANEWAGTSGTI